MKPIWQELDTDEKIAAIKSVWAPGISAAKIAAHFSGATRNAIIGMYTRHGDKLEGYGLLPKGSNGQSPRKKRKAKRPKLRIVRAPAPIITPDEYDASSLRLPLVDLGQRQCRWPVNDADHDGIHLFCGHETELGSSYCPHHFERSIGEGTRSERNAIEDLAKRAA